MKTAINAYRGRRLPDGTVNVTSRDGSQLDLRLDLFNHSPSGFEFGYQGSGPAQLALALLADYLDDDNEAIKLHQDFKTACIAHMDKDEWELTEEQMHKSVVILQAGIRLREK